MYFSQFNKKLSGDQVVEQLRSYGHLIEMLDDGSILIDKEKTDFTVLEEARQYIKQKYVAQNLEDQVKSEIYEEISENKIANIIQEHHNIKITDTVIETYVELASSKLFTLDPAVKDIRKLNKLDTLVEGKIDYKLDDGSNVAINQETQNKLEDLFAAHNEVVEYMRQTKEHFVKVLRQIGD